MKTAFILTLALSSFTGVFSLSGAVPTVTISQEAKTALPEIWQKVPSAQRLQYVRAAEMDVYRRLAERIAGIALTSDTTVKDFAVESDAVKSSFSHILKFAEITAVTYDGDVACVTANVKIEPLVRTIVREKAANGKVINVTESTRQQAVEETGVGALEQGGEEAGVDAHPSAPTSKEIDSIVEEIL